MLECKNLKMIAVHPKYSSKLKKENINVIQMNTVILHVSLIL